MNKLIKAATNFKESAEYAGVLKNGVLTMGESGECVNGGDSTLDEGLMGEAVAENIDEDCRGNSIKSPVASDVAPNKMSVKLPSGLVISYDQDLAPAFAFGAFGTELKALDDAISDYYKADKLDEPVVD